ncbi:hypothetical protein KP509_10G039700 [Ceratopteris richardii]|uniref:Bifunctional inhibitor/plant lipid transfer protein/seed storage helical domain-containing protein n=1 Tax=Ceratopteris richardii TaxID=49495 RepID=A0A8T2TWP3_CERRI|nr:hypothetical protein KP509_10G039700 [Ceratopteris richardii]
MKLSQTTLLLLVSALVTFAIATVRGARHGAVFGTSADSCSGSTDTSAVMKACETYVVGVEPPAMTGPGASACCDALKAVSVPCLCSQTLPSYVVQLINVEAIKKVIQTCGMEVPPGTTTCAGVKLAG